MDVALRGIRRLDGHRVLDVTVTLLVLPFALVLGLLIAIAVYLDSPGPIFFRSPRVGRDGRTFGMLKFRKMRREAKGPLLTRADDDRFTPIGRFMSATRLDELPQLWHVLRGEMRLVGPRPEVAAFVREHPDAYDEILTVTPGLTGLAQLEFAGEGEIISAHHDAAAAYREHVLPRKIELDLEYVRERSVWKDLWILALTLVLPFFIVRDRLRAVSERHRRHGVTLSLAAVSALLVVAVFAVQAGSLR